MEIQLGDIVRMKKPHPCGGTDWEITRVGADVKLRDGRLADLAPTMLDLMGLNKPEEMTGETLILK